MREKGVCNADSVSRHLRPAFEPCPSVPTAFTPFSVVSLLYYYLLFTIYNSPDNPHSSHRHRHRHRQRRYRIMCIHHRSNQPNQLPTIDQSLLLHNTLSLWLALPCPRVYLGSRFRAYAIVFQNQTILRTALHVPLSLHQTPPIAAPKKTGGPCSHEAFPLGCGPGGEKSSRGRTSSLLTIHSYTRDLR